MGAQNPISSSDDEPRPDFMLAREDPSRRRLPGPGDILLLIEVSDTTLRCEENIKLPLYAVLLIQTFQRPSP